MNTIELVTEVLEILRDMDDAVDVILNLDAARLVKELSGKLTNGDMIKAMFDIPDSKIDEGLSTTYIYTSKRVLKGGSQDLLRKQITFSKDWWNAPYTKDME